MILTKPGRDIITVTDRDFEENNIIEREKIHLIKLEFEDPFFEQLDWVVNTYSSTNRYIIKDNINTYNNYFKFNKKKYYVENGFNDGIFSFFKKNNKVLLNFNNLRSHVKDFLLQKDVFKDILRNLEIIEIDQDIYENKKIILSKWNGNVIIK